MLQLHSLELASNRLKELPSVLPLAQLTFLSLKWNQFTVLPSELLRLRSQRKSGITYEFLENPFLSDSSPLLNKLNVHVASLRDLALTACLKAVNLIAKLQRSTISSLI